MRRRLEAPQAISIHALLAESDPELDPLANKTPFISIHALLAESDTILTQTSTNIVNFYPRSPCGERLWIVPLLGIK